MLCYDLKIQLFYFINYDVFKKMNIDFTTYHFLIKFYSLSKCNYLQFINDIKKDIFFVPNIVWNIVPNNFNGILSDKMCVFLLKYAEKFANLIFNYSIKRNKIRILKYFNKKMNIDKNIILNNNILEHFLYAMFVNDNLDLIKFLHKNISITKNDLLNYDQNIFTNVCLNCSNDIFLFFIQNIGFTKKDFIVNADSILSIKYKKIFSYDDDEYHKNIKYLCKHFNLSKNDVENHLYSFSFGKKSIIFS